MPIRAPSPDLAPFVSGFWFIEDLNGAHEGMVIPTIPIPAAVLTVNIGQPNMMVDGPVVPRVSLLGVQSTSRQWRASAETYFVIAMLTLPGLARLFPHEGAASRGCLIDLGALVGDKASSALAIDTGAAWTHERVRTCLEGWIRRRLAQKRPPYELSLITSASRLLLTGAGVSATADRLGVSRRHLSRICVAHLGAGPKVIADLARLRRSLGAMNDSAADPVDGYSDQAHQIRSWKRRLGVTPGEFRQRPASMMAARFSSAEERFYL